MDAVRASCKASAICGSCIGLVENLLAVTLGDEYAGERAETTVCKCTSFTHEDVRRLILEKELKSIPQVMQELSWSTPDGCHPCRPALHHYLLFSWPAAHFEDPHTPFLTSRLPANIHKNNT